MVMDRKLSPGPVRSRTVPELVDSGDSVGRSAASAGYSVAFASVGLGRDRSDLRRVEGVAQTASVEVAFVEAECL